MDEQVFNEEVFSDVPALRPRKYEESFYPSFTGFTSVMKSVHRKLTRDCNCPTYLRVMPVEAFQYYGSCLFWLRVINLKARFGDDLTEQEHILHDVSENLKLAIPEPIYVGLQAIGRFTTKTGVKLRPEFPSLPAECTGGIPGSYGVVDEENHHWYEDYPVIGPAYEALLRRASTTNASEYVSVFAPPGLAVNYNLQGYGRVSPICDLYCLDNLGVSKSGFDNIKNTGLSFSVLKCMSSYLKECKIFKNFCFSELTSTGSVAQQIEAHPDLDGYESHHYFRATDGNVTMKSFSLESREVTGISNFYGLNVWKENLKCSESWKKVCPWSCITFTQSVEPSEKWISERNKYRNLPTFIQGGHFYVHLDDSEGFRLDVISKLVQQN